MRFAFLTAAQYDTLQKHLSFGYHLDERALRTQTEKLLDHISLYYGDLIANSAGRINDLQKQDKRRNYLSGDFKPGMPAMLERLHRDNPGGYEDIYAPIHYGRAIRFLGDICMTLIAPSPQSVYTRVIPSFSKALVAQGGTHNSHAAIIMDPNQAALMARTESRDFILAVAADRPGDRFDGARHRLNAAAFICAYSKALLKIQIAQIASEYNPDSPVFMDARISLQHIYGHINHYAYDMAPPLVTEDRPKAQVLEFKPRTA